MVRKESTRNTKHLSKRREGERSGLSPTDTMRVCVLTYQSAAVRHFHCPLYKRRVYHRDTARSSKPNPQLTTLCFSLASRPIVSTQAEAGFFGITINVYHSKDAHESDQASSLGPLFSLAATCRLFCFVFQSAMTSGLYYVCVMWLASRAEQIILDPPPSHETTTTWFP